MLNIDNLIGRKVSFKNGSEKEVGHIAGGSFNGKDTRFFVEVPDVDQRHARLLTVDPFNPSCEFSLITHG
jgi:hypothetical protein